VTGILTMAFSYTVISKIAYDIVYTEYVQKTDSCCCENDLNKPKNWRFTEKYDILLFRVFRRDSFIHSFVQGPSSTHLLL
jgi:hypothetical protein